MVDATTLAGDALKRFVAERYKVPCNGWVCKPNREATKKGLPVIDALDECQGTGVLRPWVQLCPCRRGFPALMCEYCLRVTSDACKTNRCTHCLGPGWVPGIHDGEIHLEDVAEVGPSGMMRIIRNSPDCWAVAFGSDKDATKGSTPLDAALRAFAMALGRKANSDAS